MTHTDEVIRTPRLDLHTVRLRDYALLQVDRADPSLWIDRGFTNPHRYLVDDPGPLPYRIPLATSAPSSTPYLLRVAVDRATATIIGGSGFHGLPDSNGMVEIGLEVVAPARRQGFAMEILHGMWGWVIDQPRVTTLRYSVSPDNVASQHIVRGLGFTWISQQIDDEDGPEDVFEMSAADYRRRFTPAP
jgi:RimJ/RimL family protein N-acetyltransferase